MTFIKSSFCRSLGLALVFYGVLMALWACCSSRLWGRGGNATDWPSLIQLCLFLVVVDVLVKTLGGYLQRCFNRGKPDDASVVGTS